MRIAIDINGLFGTQTGASHYLRQLPKYLATIDKENEYFLYACFWRNFKEKIKNVNIPNQENFHSLFKRYPESVIRLAELKFGMNIQERAFLTKQLDVFHGTCNTLPELKKTKSVLTIQHFGGPMHKTNRWEQFYFHTLTEYSVRRADHIIVVAENTKNDLIDFGIPEDKITVIYYGEADSVYRCLDSPDEWILKKYNLPENFILFVGPLVLRKNFERLLRAYKIFKHRSNLDCRLVAAGKYDDDYFLSIKKLCSELELAKDVIFTNILPKEELVYFYNKASLFVYPSLWEGGGCPPLEAMACGCPVASSNMAAIREIVGDAGILFDPYNIEEMANAIERALSEEQLRNELIKKGFEQVKKFSWEKVARETLEVYKKVYNQ